MAARLLVAASLVDAWPEASAARLFELRCAQSKRCTDGADAASPALRPSAQAATSTQSRYYAPWTKPEPGRVRPSPEAAARLPDAAPETAGPAESPDRSLLPYAFLLLASAAVGFAQKTSGEMDKTRHMSVAAVPRSFLPGTPRRRALSICTAGRHRTAMLSVLAIPSDPGSPTSPSSFSGSPSRRRRSSSWNLFDPLGLLLGDHGKLDAVFCERAHREAELKKARIGIVSAVATFGITDDSVKAACDLLHLPNHVPDGTAGQLSALLLFLSYVTQCQFMEDYWGTVRRECLGGDECEAPMETEQVFDPLGIKRKGAAEKAARRAISRYSDTTSPTVLRKLLDPQSSPNRRLQILERRFAKPAKLLILLYVFEILVANTAVVRETQLIFDAISRLALAEGDYQILGEKGVAALIDLYESFIALLKDAPQLSSKINIFTQIGDFASGNLPANGEPLDRFLD